MRDYTAKTLSHSLVYSMSADEFTYMLNSAHYRILRKGVRAFGHWMIMKLNLKARWRDGSLEKILDTSKVERVGRPMRHCSHSSTNSFCSVGCTIWQRLSKPATVF